MPEFNPNKQIFQEVKKSAANTAITNLLESGVDANFIDAMIEIIERAVTTGAFVDDIVDELEVYILGDKKQLGKLDRYVKQVSSDILHQFNREYQEVVSQDIGLEFYQYTGNLVGDSREFCTARVNKFYHKKEVQSWTTTSNGPGNPVPHGSEWQGRIAGTNSSNIFINLGGWNCRHQLIAVNTRFVPKNVLIRNMENGNFKPSERVRERLGI